MDVGFADHELWLGAVGLSVIQTSPSRLSSSNRLLVKTSPELSGNQAGIPVGRETIRHLAWRR